MKKMTDRIAEERNKKGITQQQIADMLNISKPAYQNYEYGKRDIPLSIFNKLIEVFGVSAEYLLKGEELKTNLINDEEKLLNLFRNSTDIGRGMALGILMSHQKDNDNGIGIKKNA